MACDCIATVNEKLAEHNTILISAFSWDGAEHVCLWTENAKRKRGGKKPMKVMAVFCPMCGTRYATPDHTAERGEL